MCYNKMLAFIIKLCFKECYIIVFFANIVKNYTKQYGFMH